jgi:RNA polymerase sigma factor (sigma-70 family)
MESCLDRFGGLVWALARKACENATDAEDAVQDIFVDLWRSAARFDEALASEVTFVAMIARRRLIDRQRTRSRRPRSEPLPQQLASQTPTDAERTEHGEYVAHVARALNGLRPEQRQVLKMWIYDGLSHDEIAQATGLPLGTVKTHARRGLMQIREKVNPTDPGTVADPGKVKGGLT